MASLDLEQLQDAVLATAATLTSGSSVTMTTRILYVNKTTGSATAVTLPTSPVPNTAFYVVKDRKGDAFTNNITVTPSSGTIDGQSSFLINQNWMAASFLWDGSGWSVV